MASFHILIKGENIALQLLSQDSNADGSKTMKLHCEHLFTRKAADAVAAKLLTACKTLAENAADAIDSRQFDDSDEDDLDRI